MTTYGIPRAAAAGSVRRFVLHVGEMLLAMFVGMAVFGAFFSGIVLALGTTSTRRWRRFRP
jgi:hypothetical protein